MGSGSCDEQLALSCPGIGTSACCGILRFHSVTQMRVDSGPFKAYSRGPGSSAGGASQHASCRKVLRPVLRRTSAGPFDRASGVSRI